MVVVADCEGVEQPAQLCEVERLGEVGDDAAGAHMVDDGWRGLGRQEGDGFTASDRTCWAEVFSAEAVMATERTCRSLYCSARLAEVTATRAISGTAITIIPLARTDGPATTAPGGRNRPQSAVSASRVASRIPQGQQRKIPKVILVSQ